MYNTAILFLVFNRPEHTRRVWESIKTARPARLYVAADGPRAGHQQDAMHCKGVRDFLDTAVDWPCEVKHLYREENLGCGRAVSSAISWFFDQEEAGIVLEDDCLPSPSFFRFAAQKLDQYKLDDAVMHINGSFLLNDGSTVLETQPYLSLYPGIWGWASWRRAWQQYRFDLDNQRISVALGYLQSKNASPATLQYWKEQFEKMQRHEIDTWDFQWHAAIWAGKGLCVSPGANLVQNIGFDGMATHTRNSDSRYANRAFSETQQTGTELQYSAVLDRELENLVFRTHSGSNVENQVNSLQKLQKKLSRAVNRFRQNQP